MAFFYRIEIRLQIDCIVVELTNLRINTILRAKWCIARFRISQIDPTFGNDFVFGFDSRKIFDIHIAEIAAHPKAVFLTFIAGCTVSNHIKLLVWYIY